MELKAVMWKEDGMYVVKEVISGVTTQGKTLDEALENLKEAVDLFLEEMPEVREQIKKTKISGIIDVKTS